MCYLQPGKQFGVKDDADMSGLHLLRRDGVTIVHAVDEGSPAMLAGIKSGDSVVSIDGEACRDMNMKQIRQMLKTGDGDKVYLEVQRRRTSVKCEFILRRSL
jgi:C-terminal processing protease CtpA/Prc